MVTPAQGDVWWAEAVDMRRPVLVVTRSEAVPVLTAVVVAPVTTRVRGIPTEVPLGREEGLSQECVASFDNVQRIPRTLLRERVGAVRSLRRPELCRALAALADC